jgi:chromosome transmission fidelity protein 1
MWLQLMTPNDFIFAARLDNINLLKVRRFVQNSNLVNKIGGLLESQVRLAAAAEAPDNAGVEKDGKRFLWNESTRALRALLSLLSCLMNTDKDGRVVIYRGEKDLDSDTYLCIEVKFILLDPSSHFKKIVERARSVILLGGTMQPFSYVQSFLFPWLPSVRLRLFSCGHVVSSKNVAAMALSVGTEGVEFDFRHSSRLSRSVVQSLKNTLRYIVLLLAFACNKLIEKEIIRENLTEKFAQLFQMVWSYS